MTKNTQKKNEPGAAFNVITVLSVSTCAKRSQPTELCRRGRRGRCPGMYGQKKGTAKDLDTRALNRNPVSCK